MKPFRIPDNELSLPRPEKVPLSPEAQMLQGQEVTPAQPEDPALQALRQGVGRENPWDVGLTPEEKARLQEDVSPYDERVEGLWAEHVAKKIRKDYPDIPADATPDEILAAAYAVTAYEMKTDISEKEYRDALDKQYALDFKPPQPSLSERVGPAIENIKRFPGMILEGLKESAISPFVAGQKTRGAFETSKIIKQIEQQIKAIEADGVTDDERYQLAKLKRELAYFIQEHSYYKRKAISAGAEAIASYGTLPLTGARAVAAAASAGRKIALKTGTTTLANKAGGSFLGRLAGTVTKHAITGAAVGGAYGVVKGGLEGMGLAAEEGRGAGGIFEAGWKEAWEEGKLAAGAGAILGGILGTSIEKVVAGATRVSNHIRAEKHARLQQTMARWADRMTDELFDLNFRDILIATQHLPPDQAAAEILKFTGLDTIEKEFLPEITQLWAEKIGKWRGRRSRLLPRYSETGDRGMPPAKMPEGPSSVAKPVLSGGDGATPIEAPAFNPEVAPAKEIPNPEVAPPPTSPGGTTDLMDYARMLLNDVKEGRRTMADAKSAIANFFRQTGVNEELAGRKADVLLEQAQQVIDTLAPKAAPVSPDFTPPGAATQVDPVHGVSDVIPGPTGQPALPEGHVPEPEVGPPTRPTKTGGVHDDFSPPGTSWPLTETGINARITDAVEGVKQGLARNPETGEWSVANPDAPSGHTFHPESFEPAKYEGNVVSVVSDALPVMEATPARIRGFVQEVAGLIENLKSRGLKPTIGIWREEVGGRLTGRVTMDLNVMVPDEARALTLGKQARNHEIARLGPDGVWIENKKTGYDPAKHGPQSMPPQGGPERVKWFKEQSARIQKALKETKDMADKEAEAVTGIIGAKVDDETGIITGPFINEADAAAAVDKVKATPGVGEKIGKKLAAARAAADKRLASTASRMSMNGIFDPSVIYDLTTVAADEIYNGGRKAYKALNDFMVKTYGPFVQQFMDNIYENAMKIVGDADRITSASMKGIMAMARKRLYTVQEYVATRKQVRTYMKKNERKVVLALLRTKLVQEVPVVGAINGSYWLDREGSLYLSKVIHARSAREATRLGKLTYPFMRRMNDVMTDDLGVQTVLNGGVNRVQVFGNDVAMDLVHPLTKEQITSLSLLIGRNRRFTARVLLPDGQSIAFHSGMNGQKALEQAVDMAAMLDREVTGKDVKLAAPVGTALDELKLTASPLERKVIKKLAAKYKDKPLMFLRAVTTSDPDPARKAIMKIVLKRLQSFARQGVRSKIKFDPKWESSNLATTSFDDFSPFLYDYIIKFGEQGASHQTILHEAVHAAVHRIRKQLRDLPYEKELMHSIPKRVKQASKDLDRLYKHVIKELERRDAKQLYGSDFESMMWASNATHDADELLSWGLSNKGMQEVLQRIPYQKTTVWSAFVQKVGELLGLKMTKKNTTALHELLRVGEELISPDFKIEDMAKYRPRGTMFYNQK